LLYTVTDQDIVFLILDSSSCCVTIRNGNSISADVQEDTVILGFLTLQEKCNIGTLSEDITFICTCCEAGRKTHQRLAFLPVFKPHTIKLYIFQQCTYIVYISTSLTLWFMNLLSLPILCSEDDNLIFYSSSSYYLFCYIIPFFLQPSRWCNG
jgi:hypothetical protein